jgi:serine/threonine-protein kinase RIO1
MMERQMAKNAKKSSTRGGNKTSKKTDLKKAAAGEKSSAKKSRHAVSEPWADKEVERLKTLITQSTPTPLIASKLNRPLVSVRGYVQRHRLSLRPTNRSSSD